MSFLPFFKNQHHAEININLIPKDPFFETIIGKTLRWALSVGRYIVIFTELMVILSFVSRFTLDRQLTNLNDGIHQKEMVIKSYGDLEEKVRLVQTKTDQYQQIEQQANISDIFPALTKITPKSIELSELTIKPTKIAMSGRALSQQSLNILINNFQLSSNFFNVSIDRIEAGDAQKPGFSFLISAQTKELKQ
ncbi:PilN domain-containing protein [Patescibacteria group bacterium]|nr:PilN domain-containing protein [Patescibacteria group bacterium]MBU1966759.1 PilN domain-containing protein [Patescibacteria group bacterium]MBU2543410.1 PilN domain-containing protein [Patescibacteria group bacterium]